MKITDPETPAEWQFAVDAAKALVLIDSARQYGLVKGGPVVDLRRCTEILAAGEGRGIVPNDEAVDAHVRVWCAGPAADVPHETSESSESSERSKP